MPEEEKKTVDIDTSGPDATVDIEETKDEAVVETASRKHGTRNKAQEPVEKKQDEKLRRLQQRCTSSYCETNS